MNLKYQFNGFNEPKISIQLINNKKKSYIVGISSLNSFDRFPHYPWSLMMPETRQTLLPANNNHTKRGKLVHCALYPTADIQSMKMCNTKRNGIGYFAI